MTKVVTAGGVRVGDVVYDPREGRQSVARVTRRLVSREPRRYGVKVEFTTGFVREFGPGESVGVVRNGFRI